MGEKRPTTKLPCMSSNTEVESHMLGGRNKESALCHDVKRQLGNSLQCGKNYKLSAEGLVLLFIGLVSVKFNSIRRSVTVISMVRGLATWGSMAVPLLVHVCCPLQRLWKYSMQVETLSSLHRVHLFVSTEQLLFQWPVTVLSKGLTNCHHTSTVVFDCQRTNMF